MVPPCISISYKRKEVRAMKRNKNFIIWLSVLLLLIFFLTALTVYAFFVDTDGLLYNILLVQLIVFTIAACSIIIYFLIPILRKPHITQDITKIVLLSENENAMIDKYSLDLSNKTSALICKGDTIYFRLTEGALPTEEYAVLNRVEQYWYIESITDARRVGIKRAGEQYVYKLKKNMPYRLQSNDVIHIKKERLLIT